jgi:hypothetical protein
LGIFSLVPAQVAAQYTRWSFLVTHCDASFAMPFGVKEIARRACRRRYALVLRNMWSASWP